MDYTYADFCATLDDAGRDAAQIIHEQITGNDPEYQPFDIRPTSKSAVEWTLSYRKRPKTGKAFCTLLSINGQLNVRFCLLSSMTHDLLLRQDEFSTQAMSGILRQMLCCVDRACRCYGGNKPCPWRQNYWIHHRLVRTCPYPWVMFDSPTGKKLDAVKRLIDLQMKHMTQNSKDIKGGAYAEENMKRCGDVRTVVLEQALLDADTFDITGSVRSQAQLDKYAHLYHLIPMGGSGGLWFYHSDRSVMGEDYEALANSFSRIPEGRYATVTIADPMKFSVNRVWNYLCEWLAKEKIPIREIILNERTTTVCLVRFAIVDGRETMEMLIPIGA